MGNTSSSTRTTFATMLGTSARIPVLRPALSHFFRSIHQATQSDALALIRSQPSRYVVASVVGRKHLLAPRDLLTVPRLRDVRVGDRLLLNEIHELGSRDYTLRGEPLIPQDVVKVEATVVEHTKGPMERIVKFKKRKHYKKTKEHKQTYTRLRIGPIILGGGVERTVAKETQL